MTERCQLCGEGIHVTLEVTRPTIHDLEVMINAVEVQGRLIGCGISREKCDPLIHLQRAKDKALKETHGAS